MEAKIYNQKGEEKGKLDLPEKFFGLPWNGDLVHQVMTSMLSNSRSPIAHTKDRSEVRGGGKKPWRQKGTGRARHGSSRSPIWVGGGVTHGPRSDRNFSRKINKKMKAKAFFTVLSQKLRDGEILFAEAVNFDKPRTKDAQTYLSGLAKIKGYEKLVYKTGKRAILALPEKDENLEKSFRNIKSASLMEVSNINPLDLLNYKYLVVLNPEKSLEALSARAK
ncbi:MAG TPA: 50S ribosomal protein L4 [Candidatus Paceibacterota bacterium]|nr:50S ribosomal protein L4 [Candidatus Paceibacterota bacterium]HOY11239.1 50S ribosomal protein L4 [Candidatus Paceibacterota bacterium]HPB60508.1 50S ribosomal protein L4 [Candidatus Paceibacterota bacterium]HPI24681.1 50S ribosomal protein L4 [Candidatus Paceibacterota bacterium]HPN89331.1 50S ribosomal protein L4 [Candidatus Paceibacterota bacterium]